MALRNSPSFSVGALRDFILSDLKKQNAHNAVTFFEGKLAVRHIDDGTMQGAIIPGLDMSGIGHQHAFERFARGRKRNSGAPASDMEDFPRAYDSSMALLED